MLCQALPWRCVISSRSHLESSHKSLLQCLANEWKSVAHQRRVIVKTVPLPNIFLRPVLHHFSGNTPVHWTNELLSANFTTEFASQESETWAWAMACRGESKIQVHSWSVTCEIPRSTHYRSAINWDITGQGDVNRLFWIWDASHQVVE